MTVVNGSRQRTTSENSDAGTSPLSGVVPSRVYDGDILALGGAVVDEIQPTLDMLAAHDRGEQIDAPAQGQ